MQADRGTNEDDPALTLSREKFSGLLALLGVFATKEQVRALLRA